MDLYGNPHIFAIPTAEPTADKMSPNFDENSLFIVYSFKPTLIYIRIISVFLVYANKNGAVTK